MIYLIDDCNPEITAYVSCNAQIKFFLGPGMEVNICCYGGECIRKDRIHLFSQRAHRERNLILRGISRAGGSWS